MGFRRIDGIKALLAVLLPRYKCCCLCYWLGWSWETWDSKV